MTDNDRRKLVAIDNFEYHLLFQKLDELAKFWL